MKIEVKFALYGFSAAASLVAGVTSCADQPTEPPDRTPAGLRPSVIQVPEEEILGGVYSNTRPVTPLQVEGWTARLEAIDEGACIFRAGSPSQCLTSGSSTTMPVMAEGSRPGKITEVMWGWFDNMDTDNNPCDPNNSDTAEWHDLDQNDVRDDGDEELHCIRPGRYRIDVLDGGVVKRTRIVDHVRTTSSTLNGKVIEEPGQSQANDTFLHTELTSSVSVSNNVLAIDNPQTEETFAPSDTVVLTNVRVRFDSRATTSWDGDPRGPLMNRVYFDRVGDPGDRTGYWNPDLVIRTHPYEDTGSFKTRAEIATPKDPTGDTNRLSPERTII
ncbi:MAG: hypothetical protein ACREMD_13010, partial [Gemmatimonadota bacterium]